MRSFRNLLATLALLAVPGAASILYVGDSGSNGGFLRLYDGTTGAAIGSTAIPNLGDPRGMAFGPDGNLYVADNFNGVIDRFDANGVFIDEFVSAGATLFSPAGLVFDAAGFMYVANSGGFISRFDSNGLFVDYFVAAGDGPPGGLGNPFGIVFGPDSNLYVGDGFTDGIARFTPGGAYSSFVPLGNPPSPLSAPEQMAFGPGGLYVADATTGSVLLFNSLGGFVGEFGETPLHLAQPIGLAFGPDGNLYVTDSQARVARFDGITGAFLGNFVDVQGGGLVIPQFLVFSQAVPEPSTFALIAIGGVVVFWRRKRRS